MFEEFKKGQPVAVSIFEKAILEDKISHAYLIDINNYEKAYELIITFVKSIVCKNKHSSIEESKDCHICKRIDDGNYLELKIIEPDGTWINKEQLMVLQDSFSTIGIEGSKRIYVIKECDKMNLQTANSILKFLEEPADNIIAILMTNNISKLLETIVSRCQLIRLNNSKSTLGNTIEKFANLTLSETVDKQNFIQNEKNVEFIENLIKFIKEFENKKRATIVNIKKIWHNHYNNRETVDMALDLLINFYYDVLLLLVDREILFFNDYIEDVEFIKTYNTVNSVLNKLDTLIDAKSVLKYNLNLNLFIDKLIIDMSGGY